MDMVLFEAAKVSLPALPDKGSQGIAQRRVVFVHKRRGNNRRAIEDHRKVIVD